LIQRLAVALFLAAVSGLASGAYPERPIRLLVPSSAGSGPDTVARILATRLSIIFDQ
jgi:tripartite-type tricarboxylate transporter receptor subunit TctC